MLNRKFVAAGLLGACLVSLGGTLARSEPLDGDIGNERGVTSV